MDGRSRWFNVRYYTTQFASNFDAYNTYETYDAVSHHKETYEINTKKNNIRCDKLKGFAISPRADRWWKTLWATYSCLIPSNKIIALVWWMVNRAISKSCVVWRQWNASSCNSTKTKQMFTYAKGKRIIHSRSTLFADVCHATAKTYIHDLRPLWKLFLYHLQSFGENQFIYLRKANLWFFCSSLRFLLTHQALKHSSSEAFKHFALTHKLFRYFYFIFFFNFP